jgi:putative inorganic carbon (hco3(-)) transporter
MDPKRQIIETQFDRFVVFFYCLLIYFLPISIALTESLAGFVIVTFVIKKIMLLRHDLGQLAQAGKPADARTTLRLIWESTKLPASPLNIPLGIFILFSLLSVFKSAFFMSSLVAFFAKLMEGYLLYFSFAECFKTKQHLRNFVVVYFVSVLLMGVNGVTQYITKVEFIHGTPLENTGRISSSLRHANDYGAYLLFVIPIFLSLLVMPYRRLSFLQEWKSTLLGAGIVSKMTFFFLFCLTVTCLGLTYSRGSWMGFLFSLLALVIFQRRHYFWVVSAGLIFMVIFMPFLVRTRDVSFVSDNVTVQQEVDSKKKVNLEGLNSVQRWIEANRHIGFNGMGRTGFWSEATRIIKQAPVLGNGLNTYSKMAKQFGYPHNCYLQMAAEIGLAGLLAFLFVMGTLLYLPLKAVPGMTDPFLKYLMAGAAAGLVGFLIQSFFDTSFYSVQLGNLMWIFMGLIVAIHRQPQVRSN